jgi:hypothetical protein
MIAKSIVWHEIKLFQLVKKKMNSSKFKLKFISEVILIIWFAMILPMEAQDNIYAQTNLNQQLQYISINLERSDLQQPNILRIVKIDNIGKGELKGQVKLEGQTIRAINGGITEINLSSLLKPGKNILEITAVYTPINSSIKVDFEGANNFISQQTGGSGKLNQRFIIDIN